MRPSRTATPSSVRPRLPRLDSSAHLGHIFFHLPQGGPEAGLRRERSELEGFSVRGFATPQMSGDQSSCDLTRPIESLQCLIRLAERSVGDSQIEPGRGVLVPFGYLRASSLNQVGEENAALVLPSRLHQSQSVKQHPSGPTSAAGDDVEHAGRKTPGFLNVLNGTLEVPDHESGLCRPRSESVSTAGRVPSVPQSSPAPDRNHHPPSRRDSLGSPVPARPPGSCRARLSRTKRTAWRSRPESPHHS